VNSIKTVVIILFIIFNKLRKFKNDVHYTTDLGRT